MRNTSPGSRQGPPAPRRCRSPLGWRCHSRERPPSRNCEVLKQKEGWGDQRSPPLASVRLRNGRYAQRHEL